MTTTLKMDFTVIFFLLGSYIFQLVSSEAFSATANLVNLVEGEQKLIEMFDSYLKSEETRIASLRRSIEEMKAAREFIQQTSSLHYAGHPIDAYNLIKRWYKITTEFSSKQKAEDRLKSEYKYLPLPSENDYKGAIAALLRLQRVFAMDTEEMIRGFALTDKGVHELYPEDYKQIGDIAFQNNDYGLAIQWLEEAANEPSEKAAPHMTHKTLARAYQQIGDLQKATEHAKKASEAAPTLKRFYENMLEGSKDLPADYQPKYNAKNWDRNLPDWRINYEKLCRGELDATADPNYTKNLYCRYKPSIIPYYVFKEEILSWDPRIGMFYDVISDKEADMIIEKAYPKLYRAVVGDPANAFATSERISKVAWLWDEDKSIKKLSEKVKLITGLETAFSNPFSKSEPFQVVNYGMGGQYEPHVDYYENSDELLNVPDFIKNTGDRIATFLFYLSDIRHGGATVYPRQNVRVSPVKNAAAFWYNAKLNGELDKRTEHAGCPVLIGQKWVINKWIRQYGQEFTRRCGLKINDIDKS